MKTEIDKPHEVIARMLRFASEAAEEQWWEAVQEITEQVLKDVKEIVPHWGGESGEYPICKQDETNNRT
jgi:hypothetical protein